MSKYTIDSSTLTNIADAIRAQTGGSSQITPLEMPTKIASISGGGGGGVPPIPAFTKTLIATTDVDNAPDNLVFTGDYTTQDFLEISMQNTSSLETNKFITSPEIITHSFTVSNDRYSVNEAGTNQYGCYILEQGGDWCRNTNRNLLIKEIYGWNCSNYDIIKTDFYKRDPYAGTNVTVNAPAGDSFYNYDFLFIACSTGDYDDAGDNPLIYPIRTDFGTDYKIGLGINKYYSLDGYVLSGDTLSEGPYLYVQGIKFNNPNDSETGVVLRYTDDMGYAKSGSVIENRVSNLLALATTALKDLQIIVKVGTATFNSSIMQIYANSKYLRLTYNSSNSNIGFLFDESASSKVEIDPSKELKIIIHTSTKKFEFIQDGTTLDQFNYWVSDMSPFNTLSGSTSIYAKQNWLELLSIKFI